jgi:hypothetical protein
LQLKKSCNQTLNVSKSWYDYQRKLINKFEKALSKFDSVCKQNDIPYVVIGGFAAIIHGMHRLTQDIHITIAVEIDSLKKFGNIFFNSP